MLVADRPRRGLRQLGLGTALIGLRNTTSSSTRKVKNRFQTPLRETSVGVSRSLRLLKTAGGRLKFAASGRLRRNRREACVRAAGKRLKHVGANPIVRHGPRAIGPGSGPTRCSPGRWSPTSQANADTEDDEPRGIA